MATFTDDFNRADGALGANWSVAAGSAVVASNVMDITANSTTAVWATQTDNTEEYAQATLVSPGATQHQGVFVRGDGTTQNMYYFRRTNATTCDIAKVVANTFTSIQTIAAATTNGSVMRIEARGSTIRCLIDGIQVLEAIDTDLTTGRRVGVRNAVASTGGFDNFSAGDLAPLSQTVTNGRVASRNSRRNRSFRR
jgi:Tfp pilus assembly major pilin PilA